MTDVTPPSGPPGGPGDLHEAGDELTPEELACSYLDGELGADERARVEADPALLALVAELRAVSEAVAAPVAPLTDSERAAMVAAAMGTIPTVVAGGEAGRENAAAGERGRTPVTSLDAARARRSARLVRTVAGGLAAAAAVGLVALVLTRGGDGTSENTTAGGGAATVALEAAAGGGAAETTAEDVAAADAAADTVAAGAEAPTAEAPASEAPGAAAQGVTSAPTAMSTTADAGTDRAVPDLGPVANRREARSATTAFVSVVPPVGGTSPCAGYPPPVATATFQGTPAYVVIIEVAPEGNRLAFLDQATCAVLVKVDPANA
jgi:hypothetical protein